MEVVKHIAVLFELGALLMIFMVTLWRHRGPAILMSIGEEMLCGMLLLFGTAGALLATSLYLHEGVMQAAAANFVVFVHLLLIVVKLIAVSDSLEDQIA